MRTCLFLYTLLVSVINRALFLWVCLRLWLIWFVLLVLILNRVVKVSLIVGCLGFYRKLSILFRLLLLLEDEILICRLLFYYRVIIISWFHRRNFQFIERLAEKHKRLYRQSVSIYLTLKYIWYYLKIKKIYILIDNYSDYILSIFQLILLMKKKIFFHHTWSRRSESSLVICR